MHHSIQRKNALLCNKFCACACASLQKYLNRKSHTLSTAYLWRSLHSSTSTVLVSTGFPPPISCDFLLDGRVIRNHTPGVQSYKPRYLLRFFSCLPLTAATNEQPSHTCLFLPDYEVTCNPSSILYCSLSCLQYTKFINCKKCFRAISYGSIRPHPDVWPLAMEHTTAYCDCGQCSSVSTKP